MDSIEQRVAKGAAWLDENKPGWEKLINFEVLDLSSTCNCVLGHVFEEEAGLTRVHSWDSNLDKEMPAGYIWATSHISEWIMAHPEGYGFTLLSPKEDWAKLQDTWVELIKTRFDTGALSDSDIN